MKISIVFQTITGSWLLVAVFLLSVVSCTVAEQQFSEESVSQGAIVASTTTETNPTTSITSQTQTQTPSSVPTRTLPETIVSTPIPTSTVLAGTMVPSSLPSLPTPTRIITTSSILPSPSPTKEAISISNDIPLPGPLVGFRSYDNEGAFVAILDVGSPTIRIIREEVGHPFGQLWYNNGCQIYLRKGLVDLHGTVVWPWPDLDWETLLHPEGAYSNVSLLSPDRKWLTYNILYGEQFYEDAEFTDLGIVDLSRPTNPIFVTNDGRANRFAWSPDSLWLAYKHVDEAGIPQLFRVSPDGQNREQLTFHTERSGIGYIVWSPNSRYVAYAGYQSTDGGKTGVGWVDVIDTNTLSLYRAQPTTDGFGGVRQNGIWWSADSTRLVFTGRDWQGVDTTTQIYWVDMQENAIIDSFSATVLPNTGITEVYALGSVEQILFRTYDGYYILNATDKSYKQILLDLMILDQQIEGESAPFRFPGEENCGS